MSRAAGKDESVGCAAAEPARGSFISLQTVFGHRSSVTLGVPSARGSLPLRLHKNPKDTDFAVRHRGMTRGASP